MKYNPQKHHRPFGSAQGRRSIRLKGYDYSQPGWYFVTIVTQNREMLFGDVENREMVLNLFGKIIDYHWKKLPQHFRHVQLDEYQIMPNHFHGIIEIVVGSMHSDWSNKKYDENISGSAGAMHSDKNNKKYDKNVSENASPQQLAPPPPRNFLI